MPLSQKYLVVIAGPTGVGKTQTAIQLAKHFNSKIISADSRQFYKEMNIGTAKPSETELAEAEHFFINTKSIHESYTVGDYEKEVVELLKNLFKIHHLVFLVGGSGLYINAVLYGMDEFEPVSEKIKKQVSDIFQTSGIEGLQKQLEQLDSDYYNEVDTKNPQRMMRAIEVCLQTKKTYSGFLSNQKKTRPFETIKILLNTNRETLYEKINLRTDAMIKNGLIKEAESLYPHKHLNALNTVGYKELFDYFENKTDLNTAIELIKQKTRNYAKRQLTWFNNQDTYEVFNPNDFEKIKAYIEIILQHS